MRETLEAKQVMQARGCMISLSPVRAARHSLLSRGLSCSFCLSPILQPPAYLQAELEARAKAKGQKILCEHGHEHDVCCGAGKGEVEEGEV